MATTVQGAVVALVNASPAVAPLLPQGAFAGEEPQEAPTPPSCIILDKQDAPRWLTPTWREELHKVTALCYGKAAAVAAAKNPADALADAVEAAVDWQALPLASPALTLGVKRSPRSFAVEAKRAPDGERVYLARVEWLVVLSMG